MKMDVMSELNGSTALVQDKQSIASATDIGREFVRQYYTLLSEHPEDVFRFYSHESIFVHNEHEAIGQQKIQKAIEGLGFVECKVRIHSIRGSHSLGQGIVLQVCGEMAYAHDEKSRRFVQTFVLCQQTPKKFFVQNDIFQFVENCFLKDEHEVMQETAIPEPVTTVTVSKNSILTQSTNLNGHAPTGPSEEELAPPPATVPQETVISSPPKKEKEHKKDSPKQEKKESVVQPPNQSAPTVAVAEKPTSWAKLVGGGGSGGHQKTTSTPTPPIPQPPPQAAPVVHSTETVQKERFPREKQERYHQRDERTGTKLYIGGITRNIIPDFSEESTVQAEIFDAFSQYGEVEAVSVPRKVYDKGVDGRPSATAFAFVTMKSSEDVQKVFDACTKDDSRAHTLKMEVPAFGFNGSVSVTISEHGSTLGGRGGYRGRGTRGGFIPRGGRGRGNYGGNH